MMKVSLWALALLSVTMTADAFAQSGNGGGTSRKPATVPSSAANRPASPPSVPATPPTTGVPWTRTGMTQAEWLLAKRLSSLDHMRDIAEQNGNQRLLERAEKLKSLAWRQYDRRTDFSHPHDPVTP